MDDWRTRAKPATYPASQSAYLNTQPAPKLRAKRKLPVEIQANAAKSANGTGGAEDLTTGRLAALPGTFEHFRNEMVLPYPPTANLYWRAFRGRVVKSKTAREYQRRVRELLVALPADGDVSVDVTLYRPAKRGDLDNSLKVLLDALKGIAYRDDRQVARLAARRDDSDPTHPRAVVVVEGRRP